MLNSTAISPNTKKWIYLNEQVDNYIIDSQLNNAKSPSIRY